MCTFWSVAVAIPSSLRLEMSILVVFVVASTTQPEWEQNHKPDHVRHCDPGHVPDGGPNPDYEQGHDLVREGCRSGLGADLIVTANITTRLPANVIVKVDLGSHCRTSSCLQGAASVSGFGSNSGGGPGPGLGSSPVPFSIVSLDIEVSTHVRGNGVPLPPDHIISIMILNRDWYDDSVPDMCFCIYTFRLHREVELETWRRPTFSRRTRRRITLPMENLDLTKRTIRVCAHYCKLQNTAFAVENLSFEQEIRLSGARFYTSERRVRGLSI